MYSLNIGGVKPWLTLSSDSNKKPLRDDSDNDKPPDTPPKDKRLYSKLYSPSKRPLKSDSSHILSSDLSKALINATISEEEEKIYEKYVEKFQSESISMDSNPPSLHADYSIFQNHTNFGESVGCISRLPRTVEILNRQSLKDPMSAEILYAIYVESSKITNKFILPTTNQDLNRYESYRRWVECGSLSQINTV
jgi:hypothetical protein